MDIPEISQLKRCILIIGIVLLTLLTGCTKKTPSVEENNYSGDSSVMENSKKEEKENLEEQTVKNLLKAKELEEKELENRILENRGLQNIQNSINLRQTSNEEKENLERDKEIKQDSAKKNTDDGKIKETAAELEQKKEQERLKQVTPKISKQAVLGEFKTYYGDSSSARCANIENAAKKINGTLLKPGESFSCYDLLSPFTKENGYQAAGAYQQGKVVSSVGGGVCQVSTTLYNAVLEAELKVTERAAHSMTIGYVKLSRDAAIAGDYKDLKFKNNLENPIAIRAVTKDGWLIFRIEGTEVRDKTRSISFETVILSETPPGDDVITVDESQPADYTKVTQQAHKGYETELYKIISINGEEVERIRINKSVYHASPRHITVGK